MDNGNIRDNVRNGLYVREVMACDHVGINFLVTPRTKNFLVSGSAHIVFEEDVCKVVCPACLLKATGV